MNKIIFIIILVFVVVSINNLPPIRWLYGSSDCMYSNSNGTFTYSEMQFKGDDFQSCQEKFYVFKTEKNGDTILYRLCPKNIFHFWDYGQYLFSAKYRLPYKSWDEIDKRRGPIINKSGFQDF